MRRLIERLQSPSSRFYVHLDQHAEAAPFVAELAGLAQVHLLAKRETGIWGDVGVVKAAINGLRQIVEEGRGGYCVLLSGQDYPIKPVADFERFLQAHYGTCFIETFALPSPRWDYEGMERITYYKYNLSAQRGDYVLLPGLTTATFWNKQEPHYRTLLRLLRRRIVPVAALRPRTFPAYLRPFGGSSWWALPIEVVHQALTFLAQHPDYLAYHTYTLAADEVFFQSIAQHLVGPELIQPSVTYANWEREGVPLPVTFGAADLDELLAQPTGKYLARKFDAVHDGRILDLLDRTL